MKHVAPTRSVGRRPVRDDDSYTKETDKLKKQGEDKKLSASMLES